MWWIFTSLFDVVGSAVMAIFNFSCNGVIDFGIYVFLDVIVKTSLRDCRNESEKKVVWLVESILLFVCALFLHYTHHTPYVMIGLVLTTFLYIILMGRIDFSYWWNKAYTHWDDFNQHEESVEIFKERKAHEERVLIANAQQGRLPQQMMPQTFEPGPDVVLKGPIANSGYSIYPQYAPQALSGNYYGGLIRRPLHSSLASPTEEPSGIGSRLKTKVLSAFGKQKLNPYPPGLLNSGNNLCFMNSILQCLSNTAQLLECMQQDWTTVQSECSEQEGSFVLCLLELMQGLCAPPGQSANTVLSHKPLREAASKMKGSLITHPNDSDSQSQQDVAEFLMWLLGQLNTLLNQASSKPGFPPKYQTVTLEMLNHRYNKAGLEKLQEIRDACIKEIAMASGLSHSAYALPVQKLSEVEWLLHHAANDSSVDHFFTGQLLESQLCNSCHRISVTTQTFTILPVPIVEDPKQDKQKQVSLEDCFNSFTRIEELYGADGLQCSCSNTAVIPISPISSPTSHKTKGANDLHKRRAAIKASRTSAFESFSTAGNNFKTSTPIHSVGAVGIPVSPIPRLTDGQRRCLLTQLPECLIVQLMRYSYHNGLADKVHKAIHIPLTNLDLTPVIMTKVMTCIPPSSNNASSQYRYYLYALCVHYDGENTNRGHYVAYARARNGVWYKYDDENVKDVNMEYEINTRVVRENAYLLFYRRIPV